MDVRRAPYRVMPHHVPVLVYDISALIDEHWDMSVAQVVKFIDGVSHIKRIAQVADMDLIIVTKAIEHLV